jgi:hypothetical protein
MCITRNSIYSNSKEVDRHIGAQRAACRCGPPNGMNLRAGGDAAAVILICANSKVRTLTPRRYDDFIISSYQSIEGGALSGCRLYRTSGFMPSPEAPARASRSNGTTLPRCRRGGQIAATILTGTASSRSIKTVQVCRSRWPAKREFGALRRCIGEAIPELPPQLSAASSSPKCHWALRCKAWEGGEGRRPASQETCLSESSFRRAGRACGAGFRCGDKSNCHADGGRHG